MPSLHPRAHSGSGIEFDRAATPGRPRIQVALVLAAACLLPATPDRTAAQQPADSAQAVGAITRASRAFSAAYVAGDTEALTALYTVDAMLLPPEGDVRGREAIGRYFAPTSRGTNVAHAMTSDELRLEGDRAVDVGTWTHTFRPADGPESTASGRYLVVWRRGGDGAWRIEFDAWHRPRR